MPYSSAHDNDRLGRTKISRRSLDNVDARRQRRYVQYKPVMACPERSVVERSNAPTKEVERLDVDLVARCSQGEGKGHLRTCRVRIGRAEAIAERDARRRLIHYNIGEESAINECGVVDEWVEGGLR